MSYMYNFTDPDTGMLPPSQGESMSSLNSDQEPQEIELYSTFQELEVLESQADLYAIMVATEHLERAYVRGIDYQEYKTECLKLLSQFKLAERAALRAGNIKTTEYVV